MNTLAAHHSVMAAGVQPCLGDVTTASFLTGSTMITLKSSPENKLSMTLAVDILSGGETPILLTESMSFTGKSSLDSSMTSFVDSVLREVLVPRELGTGLESSCSVLASLERRRVKTSQGDGCLFFCFMKLACCPRPTSSDCMLSSQWSLHDSPRVNAFQTIMPPLEHYNHVCGSFFSGSSHVSFFLSGILCVIPPMCDDAWRFLPSSM